MVSEDLFLLNFVIRPPPVHPYFYPSIFVFTRPNDGWTGLYIKLCCKVRFSFDVKHLILLTQYSRVCTSDPVLLHPESHAVLAVGAVRLPHLGPVPAGQLHGAHAHPLH